MRRAEARLEGTRRPPGFRLSFLMLAGAIYSWSEEPVAGMIVSAIAVAAWVLKDAIDGGFDDVVDR